MNPFISLTSGILSSLMPCLIVFFPLLAYKFFNKNKIAEYLLFVLGFLASFLLFGISFRGALSSPASSGIKLGLGILFVALSILSFFDKINPLNFPLIKNNFLLGMSFSLIFSFSPCTIPYLSLIIALDKANLIINLLMFGLGLILPSLAFAFFSQSMLNFTRKSGKLLHNVTKTMNLALLISGIYLAYSIRSFGIYDLYMSFLLLAVTFVIIIRSYFIIYSKKDFLKIKNILLIISLLLIMSSALMHCSHSIKQDIKENGENSMKYSCSYSNECSICKKCISIYGIAALLGSFAIYASTKINSGKKKN